MTKQKVKAWAIVHVSDNKISGDMIFGSRKTAMETKLTDERIVRVSISFVKGGRNGNSR